MKWNGGGGERQDQPNRAEGTVSPETALAEATTRNNKIWIRRMGRWLSDHPWLAVGGLQTLELMPLGPLIGYSMADAIVGLDGFMDMIEGAFENRHTKIARIGLGVRGIAKIGIAAAPALPVSGASVLLNRVINVHRKNT